MFPIDAVNKELIETKDFKNPFEFDLTNVNAGREELHLTDENQHVLKNFQNTIEFKNNRYVTKLPIKKMNKLLPDNYTVAKKRLDYLEKQLTKNKNLFTDYNKVIKQYLEEGIVEFVENNNNKTTPGQVHYLPHRAVIREKNEIAKLRIAFDASSKAKGEQCLNDILYSGPCLLPYLYGILLRFRSGKFGLVANINQAFLQIGDFTEIFFVFFGLKISTTSHLHLPHCDSPVSFSD